MSRKNHYFALMSAEGEAVVTLPAPHQGTSIAPNGFITCRAAFWEGMPPPWCVQIVEVLSEHGWADAKDEEKTIHWAADALLEHPSRVEGYLLVNHTKVALRYLTWKFPDAMKTQPLQQLAEQLNKMHGKDVL